MTTRVVAMTMPGRRLVAVVMLVMARAPRVIVASQADSRLRLRLRLRLRPHIRVRPRRMDTRLLFLWVGFPGGMRGRLWGRCSGWY